jgi:hypothetical protein
MLTKKTTFKEQISCFIASAFQGLLHSFLTITPLKMLFAFASYKFFFSYFIIKAKKRKQTSLQRTNNTPIHHEILHTIVLQKTPL